jgi:hypothetical protein
VSTTAPRGEAPDPGLAAAHLADLGARIGVAAIDELWVFPTRRLGTLDSTVIVVSAFAEGEDDRRRVLTAHYTVRRDPRGRPVVQQEIVEHAIAPADRIARVVDGVLRRLDEEFAAAAPRPARIAGDEQRFAELVERIGGSPAGSEGDGAEAAAAARSGIPPAPSGY